MSEYPDLPPDAARVSCPTCATQLPCHDPASSRYFCCPTCRTFFGATPGVPGRETRRLDQFKRAVIPGAALPLGATGQLGGHRCRITGYQVRSEKQDSSAEWREYQLRPLYPGGASDPADFPLQLAEYQGHWLLVRRATFVVKSTADGWEDPDGRDYRLWHRYQPVIRDAQGEFDWNILDDEHLHIEEFISPPYQLVREQMGRSTPAWYRAEYLEPAAVAGAFGIPVGRLPYREGIGAAQPGRVANWPQLRTLAWLAGLLLLGAAGLLALLRPSGTVVQDALTAQPATGGSSQVLTSKSFVVDGPTALDVELRIPSLDNHWVEVTASLVNEQTGQGYEFTRSVEYYHGYEDGENWSEGGTEVEALLSRVPGGRYHFNLYPSLDPTLLGSVDLTLKATARPMLWSNFWLLALGLASVPVVLGFWRRSFEAERWQNSNFNPYASGNS